MDIQIFIIAKERERRGGNYNPSGKNQFNSCPPKDCPRFLALLRDYHKICTNREQVSDFLKSEHGITVSPWTVGRRWREMGLYASHRNEEILGPEAVLDLIMNQVSLDTTGKFGQLSTKAKIAQTTGHHIKQRSIAAVQKVIDPVGVLQRYPSAKTLIRAPLSSDGPNETWCCDGHDKLVQKGGFGVWGIRDKFSRRWLGLWVVPNNRLQMVTAYLWLTLVRDMGGMPITTSTDCGNENQLIMGLGHALMATLDSPSTRPPHLFLRSVNHTPIERGWRDWRKIFGEKFAHIWDQGHPLYDDSDPLCRLLAQWFWPRILQREMNKFTSFMNNSRVRRQPTKTLPSGVSPRIAYTFPERFGGTQCLQPVNVDLVDAMLADMEGAVDNLKTWDVPEALSIAAQTIMESYGIPSRESIVVEQAWVVYGAILLELRNFNPVDLGLH